MSERVGRAGADAAARSMRLLDRRPRRGRSARWRSIARSQVVVDRRSRARRDEHDRARRGGGRSRRRGSSCRCAHLRRAKVTSASRPSVVDAAHWRDAPVVGVLDLAHLGDRVGDLDQLRRRVAAGDDDVDVRRSVADRGDDIRRRRSSPTFTGRSARRGSTSWCSPASIRSPPPAAHPRGASALSCSRFVGVPREAVAERDTSRRRAGARSSPRRPSSRRS